MTHIMEVPFKALVITPTDPGGCEMCEEVTELRPYGEDGKFVCFKCAMKNEKEAEKRFQRLIDEVS